MICKSRSDNWIFVDPRTPLAIFSRIKSCDSQRSGRPCQQKPCPSATQCPRSSSAQTTPSMSAFSPHYRVKTRSGTRSCLDLEESPVVDDVRNDDLVERVPYILGEWKSIVKLTMRGMLTNSLESQPCPCAAPVHHLADETDAGEAPLPHHPLAIPL